MFTKASDDVDKTAKDNPLVALIVVNWNGLEDTLRCITSINENDYPNKITIVIDNGSDIDISPILLERHPEIECIRNQKNMGYGYACNVGIRRGMELGAEFFLPLNNDLILDRKCISAAIELAKQNHGIGAIAPKILWLDSPDVICSVGSKADFLFLIQLRRQLSGMVDTGQFAQSRVIDASGIFMISKEVVVTSGLFDEEFFLYLEDFDYCIRIRENGYLLMYEPRMVMWHKGSASLGGPHNPTAIYFNTRNRFIIWKKHLDAFSAISVVFTYLLVTAPIRIVYLLTHDREIDKTKAYLRGIAHGIRLYLAESPRNKHWTPRL